MDPLTALGLAANVFACISFATGLIKGTIEISTSPQGCSADTLKLESIYNDLESLCIGLKSSMNHQVSSGIGEGVSIDRARTIATAVKTLSAQCKTDCDDLLGVITNLKVEGGTKGRWASFRIALRMALEKKKIDQLEERLSRTQTTLTLHICTLANLSSRVQSDRLKQLQEQSSLLRSDQVEALRNIENKLDTFKTDFLLTKDLLTRSDVDCLQEQLQNLSLSENECAKEQAILQSLTFDTRPIRHAQIPTAYDETFDWAHRTDTDKKSGSSMGEWLEQGHGIFWISGKPGSGKSTLMKFIADSPTTSQLLQKWAQSSKVIIASHYFWISGTEMQKSYHGLLQTLLYEIFRQSPNLIRQICANRWTSLEPAKPWPLSELRHAFKTVSESATDLKFCFFIDGMDEFSGDHEDQVQLCQIFKDLAELRNIKLCLSSRPWNVFEEAFGNEFPKIYVQDLTFNDIQTYTRGQLRKHPRWNAVSAKHSQGQWLVSEITAKSNGVFLWVYLVVKLLREGLTNRDDIFDLRRRLQSFPSELEPFFKTILESVEPFYHSHMSTALQFAIAADGHLLDSIVFHFLAQEHSDEAYSVNLQIGALSQEEIREININTKWHLDSRTRGLLEVDYDTVQFLHRTARDFLMKKEMRAFLATKVDKNFKFNPTLSIIKAFVAMVKICPPPLRVKRSGFGCYDIETSGIYATELDMSSPVTSALKFASKLETNADHDSRHYSLLDELHRSILFLLPDQDGELISCHKTCVTKAFFQEYLVTYGVFDYLYSKIKIEPTFLANVGGLPFQRFLIEDREDVSNVSLKRGKGIDCLIHILKNKGVDLNRDDDLRGTSPWCLLQSVIGQMWYDEKKDVLNLFNILLDEGIIILSLKAGADPNIQVIYRGGDFVAAVAVYVEYCHKLMDQSQSIQALYLDVLKEYLRLSSPSTLLAAWDGLIDLLTDMREREMAPRSLSFLSRVNNLFSQVSATGMPDIMEAKSRQDAVAQKVFPLELYTPIGAAAKSSRGKRKRKNDSNEGRRERQT